MSRSPVSTTMRALAAPLRIGSGGMEEVPPRAISMLSSTDVLPCPLSPPTITTLPSGVISTTCRRFTFSLVRRTILLMLPLVPSGLSDRVAELPGVGVDDPDVAVQRRGDVDIAPVEHGGHLPDDPLLDPLVPMHVDNAVEPPPPAVGAVGFRANSDEPSHVAPPSGVWCRL